MLHNSLLIGSNHWHNMHITFLPADTLHSGWQLSLFFRCRCCANLSTFVPLGMWPVWTMCIVCCYPDCCTFKLRCCIWCLTPSMHQWTTYVLLFALALATDDVCFFYPCLYILCNLIKKKQKWFDTVPVVDNSGLGGAVI